MDIRILRCSDGWILDIGCSDVRVFGCSDVLISDFHIFGYWILGVRYWTFMLKLPSTTHLQLVLEEVLALNFTSASVILHCSLPNVSKYSSKTLNSSGKPQENTILLPVSGCVISNEPACKKSLFSPVFSVMILLRVKSP